MQKEKGGSNDEWLFVVTTGIMWLIAMVLIFKA